jgi:thiazole biosynthesis enzyme
MKRFDEVLISKAILNAYHDKLLSRIESDVVIVGAGPSGLTAAYCLARRGLKVVVLEKRLSPGGGVWGGGMGMNEVVVQEEAVPLLEAFGVARDRRYEGLVVVDATDLAASLSLGALRAGAVLLNLVTVEDLCVRGGNVAGVVVNRTMISGALHVDPITLSARATVDATGHDAAIVEMLRKRGLLGPQSASPNWGQAPMDAEAGEAFVVERVAEVYPCLWVTGMSICTVFNGPRMGPIFGGMLLSGKRAADLIAGKLER